MAEEEKEYTREELIKQLEEFKAGLKTKTSARPARYSKSSNVPYYQAHYALELKLALDTMTPDKDKFFRCSTMGNCSVRTLEARIYQSFMYLVDELDTPDLKYAIMWDHLQIRKHMGSSRDEEGVILHWAANASPKRTGTLIGEEINAGKDWKVELDNFVDKAEENDEIVLDNLLLTEEEFQQLIVQRFAPKELGFVVHPKSNKNWVKILKNSTLREL